MKGRKPKSDDWLPSAILFLVLLSFWIDANGNKLATQARDMNGNGTIDAGVDLITSYSYNAVNSKLTTTCPLSGTTAMLYDDLQRPTQITDALGHVTQLLYGANSGGNVFDSAGFKPTRTIDPLGFTTDVTYDALYRPVTKAAQFDFAQPPAATSTQYDAVGNATCVTDPLGHQTATTYDALNRPLVSTYADGSTTQAFYTSTGFKWQTIDQNGNDTQAVFDNAGRVIESIGAVVNNGHGTGASPVTQTFYDAAGNIAETENPLGQKWDYVYDARNRKLQEIDPPVLDAVSNTTLRPMRTWEYDAAGRQVAAIDAKGNETDTSYDPANRVTDVTEPTVALGAGTARPDTHTTYDLDGNVLTLTDPNSHTTTNTFDLLNRLLTSTDAAAITVTNTYDAVGNKLTVTDGKNQTTTFAYDGLKRNTSVTDAGGDTTRTRFDPMNKTERIDALGQTTAYLYDVRNRLSNVVYASSAAANSQRNYAYDPVGNLLGVAEPAKSGTADVGYTYDALNRVATETSSGLTHSYILDLAGNRLSATYGTGLALSCTYDALNRLSTLTEEGRTTGYAYDLNGNVITQTFSNGDVVTTGFDALNRRTQIATVVSTGSLSQFTQSYDLKGNLLSQQEAYIPGSLVNRTVSNTYDVIDRLANEAMTQGTVSLSTTYTYDGANNRSGMVVTGGTAAGATSYGYNLLNQLTGWSGPTGNASYGYDADGNRVSSSLGSTTYGYDYENRLVSVTQSGTNYQYVYDYRTRRVNRTEAGTSTKVVFSGGTTIAEYTGTGSSPTVQYLRGSDWGGGVGGILYTLRSGTMGVTHYDGRGDVVAKTNGSGVLTYQASYDAFGTRSQEYGSTPDRQKANTKEEDPTGLLDEGMRYRDLDTGTFITKDPAGFVDGPNLYTYVNQNPWTKFDPEGLVNADPQYLSNGKEGQAAESTIKALIPNPKEDLKAASAGASVMFDSNASISDRLTGAMSYIGHSIMAVVSVVGDGAVEKGVENGAAKVVEKALEAGVADSAKKTVATAEAAVAKDLPTKAYDVGPADELRANSDVGDKLDIHHAPQSRPAGQTIPGYDPKTAPSIALPEAEHANIPTQKGPATLGPRDQMAKDIKDLRNKTNAPNDSLQKLIQQTKDQYPGALSK